MFLLEMNDQQWDFITDAMSEIKEDEKSSQYAKVVAQQLLDKLTKLKDEENI